MKNKKFKRLIIILGVLVILFVGLNTTYNLFFNPYRGTDSASTVFSNSPTTTLTKKEALVDLSFMMEKLEERHPACMNGIPDEVQEQYNKEIAQLSDEISVLQVWQASARILNKMNDAHTGIYYYGYEYSKIPLSLEIVEGKFYSTNKEFENYLIKKINGVPIEDLYQVFINQYSYELESYAAFHFSKKIPLQIYLDFVGIDTSSDITVLFQTETGDKEVVFSFEKPKENQINNTPFVSYEIDQENSLGIFTLRSCDYNEFYQDTVKKFFTEVKENGINNIAVDLRNNGGGNSQVINEFIRYLDVEEYYITGGMNVRYGSLLIKNSKSALKNKQVKELLFNGKLFALSSTNTFSSAQMFIHTIIDNQLGEVIGEIPGNMPECYGDILKFYMPRSKLIFTVSYKHFKRIDETKAHLPLIPDYEVKAEDAMKQLIDIIKNTK